MNDINVVEWVIALGVGAIVAELIRSTFQRRKMGADAAKVITEAATTLLGPLQQRVKDLEGIIEETRKELDAARHQVLLATSELIEARREVRELRDKITQHGLSLD
jgi:uncharacterized protein HemX